MFVMRRLPYGSIHAQEMLDIIMVSAAFDQDVSLYFLDDGVFQLKNNQNPEVSQLKNTAPIFQALELYDVKRLYVEAESLAERGMSVSDLMLDVMVLPRKEISELLNNGEMFFNG
jgi:tRNA 2-thiouridine synthesizing protein C